MIISADKEKLFNQFRTVLGAPLVKVELKDDQLCTLLEIAIEDYAELAQNFLIEHQWSSLLGANISSTDFAFALSTRSLNALDQYTYAYSKAVGLQARGPWEMKKDYVNLNAGQQVYQIPAGREINEVLWITPSSTNAALMANFGGFDFGIGGGYAQTGNGLGNSGNNGGYYIAPAFDVLLMAQDLNLKNRLLRSDLTYKITAGPSGTRLLHLMSTPGSRYTLGNSNSSVGLGSLSLAGCQVWYHYYDTATSGTTDSCRADNPDIIKLPNEVPLNKLDFSTFNEPTKILVRQLFIAEAKKALGRVRGKFGGIVGPPEAQQTMDYESLLAEGNEEKKEAITKLQERLLRLSSTSQLERASKEASDLNAALKYKPMNWKLI
jgi:hypothetical protein